MRVMMMVGKGNVSTLEACERAMVCALARANACRDLGDTSGQAFWLARLAWLTNAATQYVKEAA